MHLGGVPNAFLKCMCRLDSDGDCLGMNLISLGRIRIFLAANDGEVMDSDPYRRWSA